MSDLVHIGNSEILVKEYKGQRVVTFKDIDMVHGRPDGTARKRFNDNKHHFVEGEDFFKISPSEFRTTIGEMDLRQQNDITLLSEQGYLMLVKSFTDDLAWQVQRQLVNGYFRARQIANNELSPQTQLLLQLAQTIANKELEDKERDKKIAIANEVAQKAVETTEHIKEAVQPIFDNWQDEINKKFNRIQKACNCDFATLRNEMYSLLEQRAGCNLGQRVRNEQQRMFDRGKKKTEISSYRKINAIADDKKLREIFSKIVTEYEIKYCA